MNDSKLDKEIYTAIRNGRRDLAALVASLEVNQARLAERLLWLLGEGQIVLAADGYLADHNAGAASLATLKQKSIALDLLALTRDGFIEVDGRYRISPDGVLEPVFVATQRGQREFDEYARASAKTSDVER